MPVETVYKLVATAYSITGDGAMLYTEGLQEPHGLLRNCPRLKGSGNGVLQDYCEGAGRVDIGRELGRGHACNT